jgi:hypothetical protein
MTDEPTRQGVEQSRRHEADPRTSLVYLRTLAGGERALMAWIRTSMSMIGFGFNIYEYGTFLRGGGATGGHLVGARGAGNGPGRRRNSGAGSGHLAVRAVPSGNCGRPTT